MAAGDYVDVSSQADIEYADLNRAAQNAKARGFVPLQFACFQVDRSNSKHLSERFSGSAVPRRHCDA